MLVRLRVMETKEIFVLEQKRGRAGGEANFVHRHAFFEVIRDAIDQAGVARNDIARLDLPTREEETEACLRQCGGSTVQAEFPVLVNQFVQKGRGGVSGAAAADSGVARRGVGGHGVPVVGVAVQETFSAEVHLFEPVEEGSRGLWRERHLAPHARLGAPQRLFVIEVVVRVQRRLGGGGGGGRARFFLVSRWG